MIEAIFFDIDGTLLSFKTHKMTERLQKALIEARKNGIKLFIATGRHVSEMEELEQYPYFDGNITLNGGYCVNKNGVYYKENIIKKMFIIATWFGVFQGLMPLMGFYFMDSVGVYVETIKQ